MVTSGRPLGRELRSRTQRVAHPHLSLPVVLSSVVCLLLPAPQRTIGTSCGTAWKLDPYCGLVIAVQCGIRHGCKHSKCYRRQSWGFSSSVPGFLGVSFVGLAAKKKHASTSIHVELRAVFFRHPTAVLHEVYVATRVHHGPQRPNRPPHVQHAVKFVTVPTSVTQLDSCRVASSLILKPSTAVSLLLFVEDCSLGHVLEGTHEPTLRCQS